MQWQALALKHEDVYCWDDEFVVYSNLTGETHLLDYYAGQILKILINTSFNLKNLSARLAQECSVDVNEDMLQYIAGILESLCKLSLIERF